jgi:hypothetical protein
MLNISKKLYHTEFVKHPAQVFSTISTRCGFLDTAFSGSYNPFSQRVWPSGKASPSQGDIRGFESHHPLFCFKSPSVYNNLSLV